MSCDKGRHKGMTFVEILVVMLVMSIISAFAYRLLQLGIHGSRKGREAADYVRTAGILFDIFEDDFSGLLAEPISITTQAGTTQSGQPQFQPDNTTATALNFWKFEYSNSESVLKIVSYEFDKDTHKLFRTEQVVAPQAKSPSKHPLGGGIIDSLTFASENADNSVIKVTASFKGEVHSETFFRVFAPANRRHHSSLHSWNFYRQ